VRASVSDGPPGAVATISRIGFDGYACATADGAAPAQASAIATIAQVLLAVIQFSV
jgi:hypothetical protein